MRCIILCLTLASCAGVKELARPPIDPWYLLDNFDPSWHSSHVIQYLGEPQDILSKDGESLWIYRSKNSGHQTWAIGVTSENKVSGLAYLPSSPESRLNVLEVEKRWNMRKCVHTKETKLVGHTYTTLRSLICDGGRRTVEYNRNKHVSGIRVK